LSVAAGVPQPGEISLAHNGVLFLDELPEFKRTVLEVMRQPLEERIVNIARAKASVQFPANFMLVASMNPSPSGEFYSEDGNHPDSPLDVRRYLKENQRSTTRQDRPAHRSDAGII
jgi:magnesium chelatase family protein